MIGGLAILLVLGCNNGAIEELEKKNKFLSSLANLGNEFLNVFTSFGDMISGETLGFKTDSKKSDVAAYFKKVHEKVEGTKTALNKIVENMEKEGNTNASAVKTKVDELIKDKLTKIIEGAKTASGAIGSAGESLGDVAGSNGAVVGDTEIELVKGIKDIVDIVLKGVGNADAGDDKKAVDGAATRTRNGGTDEAGKLLDTSGAIANDANGKKSAADAAKAIGAITGADILKAIVKDNVVTSALAANAKDATIAGAIALRAMAKGGKFAFITSVTSDTTAAIKRVTTSAVTKALDTLTIAIRKTIDEGLKSVKEAMNINANDNPLTSETATAAK